MTEKQFRKAFGKRIKALRLKAKLIQEDLEEFEVNVKHYQRMERGLVNPQAFTVLKLCQAFRCTPNDLFDY